MVLTEARAPITVVTCGGIAFRPGIARVDPAVVKLDGNRAGGGIEIKPGPTFTSGGPHDVNVIRRLRGKMATPGETTEE